MTTPATRPARRAPDTITTPTRLRDVPEGAALFWPGFSQATLCGSHRITIVGDVAWVFCPQHGMTSAGADDIVNVVTVNPAGPYPDQVVIAPERNGPAVPYPFAPAPVLTDPRVGPGGRHLP